MKKLWILVVAVCVVCSMAAVAQDMGKSCDSGKGKMAASAPLKTLTELRQWNVAHVCGACRWSAAGSLDSLRGTYGADNADHRCRRARFHFPVGNRRR